ncbi:MAG: nuclear transport factor 2 family protein [Steroidobacteraceae bacterium]
MKTRARLLIAIVATFGLLPSLGATAEPANASSSAPTDQVRKELLDAREAAWRSFFQDDPVAAIQRIIGPEVIAIQENGERWENRARLTAMAKGMKAQNVRLMHLEFPHTEIQLFGDTAILYYTYVFSTGNDKMSGTEAGRGTEVFVRRDGRWIDVGWHLDNGAFVRRNGAWVRLGE